MNFLFSVRRTLMATMKTLILISLIVCTVKSESATGQESKRKQTQDSALNAIQAIQKQEYYTTTPSKYYQQYIQAQPQYVQIIPKSVYMPQPQVQPHAMIIIAQPAYVPQSLLYGNPTQQLLNYFHSNPHARYQLLHGGSGGAGGGSGGSVAGNGVSYIPQHIIAQPQHHHHQQQQQQQQQPASSIGNYVFASPPQYSLSHLSQLAAAHQYANPVPIKSVPAPIITGLESFTPEQQAQIKTQLNAHLGANNYHAVPSKYFIQSPSGDYSKYISDYQQLQQHQQQQQQQQQQQTQQQTQQQQQQQQEQQQDKDETESVTGDILKSSYSSRG